MKSREGDTGRGMWEGRLGEMEGYLEGERLGFFFFSNRNRSPGSHGWKIRQQDPGENLKGLGGKSSRCSKTGREGT